jgi:probable F420-dependent oxidoreductase
MKVSAALGDNFKAIAQRARELQEAGVDGLTSSEVAHEPFLPVMLAAEHTTCTDLMTSVAVAFSRNPMTLATVAHELNAYSNGRFVLGLGSQVKSHIQWRFSMPWSHPAARMKEMIQAIHAIWDCWYEAKDLDFRGQFYTHTLMTPRFMPQNVEAGRPRVVVAAVGPLMTKAAAEVGDGVIWHAFTTEKYMREVSLPIVETTLAQQRRHRDEFEVIYPAFTVIGTDEKTIAEQTRAMRQLVAFYASTPAYRSVLEIHGWGDLQTELQKLVKADRWSETGDLIDNQVLNAFVTIGDAASVGAQLATRFGGMIDRVILTTQTASMTEISALVEGLRVSHQPSTATTPR